MELSKQESRVARLIAEGNSEKEIASKLFIAPTTVHNHAYSIRKKWKCRSAVDVCRKFILKNPKDFMLAIVFLMIQFNLTFTMPDCDLIRTNRVKTSRTCRTRTRKQ